MFFISFFLGFLGFWAVGHGNIARVDLCLSDHSQPKSPWNSRKLVRTLKVPIRSITNLNMQSYGQNYTKNIWNFPNIFAKTENFQKFSNIWKFSNIFAKKIFEFKIFFCKNIGEFSNIWKFLKFFCFCKNIGKFSNIFCIILSIGLHIIKHLG